VGKPASMQKVSSLLFDSSSHFVAYISLPCHDNSKCSGSDEYYVFIGGHILH
jgi:hypothetical protein